MKIGRSMWVTGAVISGVIFASAAWAAPAASKSRSAAAPKVKATAKAKSQATANDTDLKFQMPGRTHTFALADLKSRIPIATLTVDDPVYKTKKTYEGFWLTDLLKAAGLSEEGGDEIVFHCQDGYAPTMSFKRLTEKRALVAFREKDRAKSGQGDWETFKQGKAEMNPAPYYLVWDTNESGFPWPYQLVGVEIVDFKKTYDRIYPSDQEADSRAMRGFNLYRAKCLSCHSINLQGGVVGPELNYPKNITEYWDEKVMLQFIRNPAFFRARSKMPAFPALSDDDLQSLLGYLHWAKDHKREE